MSDSGGVCDQCENYIENGHGIYVDDDRICNTCNKKETDESVK